MACPPDARADAAHVKCTYLEVEVAAKLVGASADQFATALDATATLALGEIAFYALGYNATYGSANARLEAIVPPADDAAGQSAVVHLAFRATSNVSITALKEATAPEGAFWINLRNMLPPAWFAAASRGTLSFVCVCVCVCGKQPFTPHQQTTPS